jgi:hypothetical protein
MMHDEELFFIGKKDKQAIKEKETPIKKIRLQKKMRKLMK